MIPPGASTAGPLRLTSHAVERYRERHRTDLDMDGASHVLRELAARATPTSAKTFDGHEVWTARDENRDVHLVVKRDPGSRRAPVVVTVLPYKPEKAPVQTTTSVRAEIERVFAERRKLLAELDALEDLGRGEGTGTSRKARAKRARRKGRADAIRSSLAELDALLCDLRAAEEDELG